MQFSIITALLVGATMVAALPADMSARQATICPGTDGTPQCCATNVLNLADLNCANRRSPLPPRVALSHLEYLLTRSFSPEHSH